MTFRDQSQDYGKDISFAKRVPHDDIFERDVCNHCGLINYQNPRIIAGVVATIMQDGVEKILMCKRAIEPRKGGAGPFTDPCAGSSWPDETAFPMLGASFNSIAEIAPSR